MAGDGAAALRAQLVFSSCIVREQEGIVFIDEIDKICSRGDFRGNADASSEGVQRDLLPLIEGSQVPQPLFRHQPNLSCSPPTFAIHNTMTTLAATHTHPPKHHTNTNTNPSREIIKPNTHTHNTQNTRTCVRTYARTAATTAAAATSAAAATTAAAATPCPSPIQDVLSVVVCIGIAPLPPSCCQRLFAFFWYAFGR